MAQGEIVRSTSRETTKKPRHKTTSRNRESIEPLLLTFTSDIGPSTPPIVDTFPFGAPGRRERGPELEKQRTLPELRCPSARGRANNNGVPVKFVAFPI